MFSLPCAPVPQLRRIPTGLLFIIISGLVSAICQAQSLPSTPATSTIISHQQNLQNLDPELLLQQALEQCQRNIHDYSCLFTRQERIHGQLSKQQTIRVNYREHPRTIHMTWIINPDRVRRALYQQGKHFNKFGEELLLVEPAGLIARTVAPVVYTPVRGKKARSAARHTVDQFGFLSILKRIAGVNKLAKKNGDLKLTLVGEGQFSSRPTYRIVRRLRTGGIHHYSDPHLVIELDQQWLIPVSIRSYDGKDATKLIGAYTFRNIKMGQPLPNSAFAFKKNAVVMR